MNRTDRYEGYEFRDCRRCLILGIHPIQAVKPVVGVTVGGDEILSCNHIQPKRGPVSRPTPSQAA